MALVTKLGNLIENQRKNHEEVQEYVDSLGEDWKQFVEGELKRSNDTNNKSLGGQQPRSSMSDDEGDKDYEMTMEKIMTKFSNFNTALSNRQSSTENDDDDDDDDEEEEDSDDDNKERKNSSEDVDMENFLKERDNEYEQV